MTKTLVCLAAHREMLLIEGGQKVDGWSEVSEDEESEEEEGFELTCLETPYLVLTLLLGRVLCGEYFPTPVLQ